MADNTATGRVQSKFVPGTTERIQKAAEEVSRLLQKPKGQVTKAELVEQMDKLSALRNSDPPLSGFENQQRLSLYSSLVVRAGSEQLMTPQEIMGRRDTMEWAMGAPSGSGVPGTGGMRAPGTGPMLPRTNSPTVKIPPKTPATPRVPEGVVVQKPQFTRVGRWMSRAEYEKMKQTGRVQNGKGGSTSAATSGPDSFRKQADPGSVYVEYDVPSNSLLTGGQSDWVRTIGPDANLMSQAQLAKQGGEFLPPATNISGILATK